MARLVDGFEIRRYKSFWPTPQKIGPLSDVTVLAGPNNSGKSNVLRFAHKHLPVFLKASLASGTVGPFEGWETPVGESKEYSSFALGLRPTDERRRLFQGDAAGDSRVSEALKRLLDHPGLFDGELLWFDFEPSGHQRQLQITESQIERLTEALDNSLWLHLGGRLTGIPRQGGVGLAIRKVLLHLLSSSHIPQFTTMTIPAFRRIETGEADTEVFGGVGLIEELAKIQSPSARRSADAARYLRLNEFVRSILKDDSALVEVPYERDAVQVSLRGKLLPLSELGTGIHQLIVIAAAVTVVENRLICIEEPEIHLHPGLQRALLAYLAKDRSNQFLVATHSAQLLDAPGVEVLHVTASEAGSRVDHVKSAADRSTLCRDLGYLPSDLVQTNCVVWVEGPSDRIYLRHWLNQAAPDLVEGLHFSLMFYGGRLLSHLTANDPEVDEFISLRRLNRSVSIVMDSDRRRQRERLGDTKLRVKEEIAAGGGLVWITSGREIENYVPVDLLDKAIDTVHSGWRRVAGGRFDAMLEIRRPAGRTHRIADKIKVAKQVASEPASFAQLDLARRIEELVRFIRAAN